MQNVERLLYGKDNTQKIVSIEAKEDLAEIFTEDNGVVSSHFVSNRYWVLLAGNPGGCTRLQGDLHYKYGKQFKSREEFSRFKYRYKDREKSYCIYDPKESIMVKDGYTYFKGMSVNDVSVLSFDLETTGLDPNLDDAKILLISCTFRSQGKTEKTLFCFDRYPTTEAFLTDWANWVLKMNPSIITGHNISSFDLPYLYTIAEKEGFKIPLGRDHSPLKVEDYTSKFRKEAGNFIYYNKTRIYGREIVDTIFLSIKHDAATRKYESYALKNIIKQEGLEKEDRVFYDASKIRVNYMIPEEWEKIKAYCTDDSDDSLALYDLMIKPFFYVSQIIPKSFQAVIETATGSQINALMVRSYLQDGHSIPLTSDTENLKGAISHGNPGIYRNALKVDVSSLYPSIILQYNICDEDKDPNKHFLTIVRELTNTRLKYKKLYKETNDPAYNAMSESLKILINSAYGFCSAPGLNFNAPNCAAEITRYGREILQKAIVWATGSELQLEESLEVEDEAV